MHNWFTAPVQRKFSQHIYFHYLQVYLVTRNYKLKTLEPFQDLPPAGQHLTEDGSGEAKDSLGPNAAVI